MPDDRLGKTFNVEGRELDDAGFDILNTGNRRNPICQLFRCALHSREDLGETITFVVGLPGALKRLNRAERHHQDGNPRRDHECDGKHLTAQSP